MARARHPSRRCSPGAALQVKPAIADDAARMAELQTKLRTLADYDGPKQLLLEHAWGAPVYADRARGYNYGECAE